MKIVLQDVGKVYSTDSGNPVAALQEVSLELGAPEMIFISGTSGSGKTTLLNLLAGLDSASGGKMLCDGVDTKEFGPEQWDDYRNLRIGIIFQEYNLIPELDVYDNIALACSLQKQQELTNERKRELILQWLEFVGLNGYEHRQIAELSGGEKQRIAIARALVKQPELILADEPTGSLDEKNGEKVFTLLKKISKQYPVLVVSHDRERAERYADRILELSDGRLVRDVKNRPQKKKYVYTAVAANGKAISAPSLSQLESRMENTLSEEQAADVRITVRETFAEEEQDAGELPVGVRGAARAFAASDKLCLSAAFLKSRRLRLAVTVAALALTALLLFVFLSVENNSYVHAISRYFQEHSVRVLYLSSGVDGERSVGYEGKGEDFFRRVSEAAGNARLLSVIEGRELSLLSYEETYGVPADSAFSEDSLSYGSEERKTHCPINIIVGAENGDSLGTVIGRMPEQAVELALTDYVCASLGLGKENLGETLYLDWKEYVFCGILITDYQNSERYRWGQAGNDEESFYEEFFFNNAYISTDAIAAEKKEAEANSLPVPVFGGDLSKRNVLDSIARSRASYGTVTALSERDLIGALPKAENEILVSEEYAQQLGLEPVAASFPKTYELYDLQAEENIKRYSGCVNLYEVFGEHVTVTGCVKAADGDIYVIHSLYQQFLQQYYEYYYYNRLGVVGEESDIPRLVSALTQSGVRFSEPDIAHIYDTEASMKGLSRYFVIAFSALALLSLFLVISFISYSCKDSQRKIGILRAMGMTRRDTAEIFLAESVLLSLSALALALVGCVGFYAYLHRHYEAELLTMRSLQIFYINIPVLAVSGALFFCGCLLAALWPVRSMVRRKPVEILRGM